MFRWKNNKLLLSCLILILSFLYAFPIFNKIWHPFDEGCILVNADLVSHGMIPYKDFWAVHTPGQPYILAFLFKVFGKSLMTGRIYTIFLYSLICLMVFLITSKLCRLRFAILSSFICMVSLIPRVGSTPWPVWPAILFVLLSLMTLLFYIKRQSHLWLIITGSLVSLVFLFRHDIGIYTLLGESITVFFLSVSTHSPKALISLNKLKKVLSESILFLTPVLIILSSFLYYFAKKLALPDLFYQMFYFPLKIYPQTRGMPFPKFCFNPNMLFHQSCYFINVNQFYIPIVIIILMFSLLLRRIFKHKSLVREEFVLVALSLVGLFHLNYIRVRTDVMNLIPIMPIYLILFSFLLSRLYEVTYFYRHKFLRKAITIFVVIFMGSFVIKNMDKYMKNAYTKVMYGKIIPVKFKLGTVYIPKQDAHSIEQVVSFISNNTVDGEKIFVGNSSHVRTEGNNTIIYFLSQRLPAAKYYIFEPGLTDQSEIQKEMIESIDRDVNLIVLAEVSIPRKFLESEINTPLDNYIKEKFTLIKSFGLYSIYRKKG